MYICLISIFVHELVFFFFGFDWFQFHMPVGHLFILTCCSKNYHKRVTSPRAMMDVLVLLYDLIVWYQSMLSDALLSGLERFPTPKTFCSAAALTHITSHLMPVA